MQGFPGSPCLLIDAVNYPSAKLACLGGLEPTSLDFKSPETPLPTPPKGVPRRQKTDETRPFIPSPYFATG